MQVKTLEDYCLTVRAQAILTALGVRQSSDLYYKVLPLPGTVVSKGSFPFYTPLTMTQKVYDELQEVQQQVIREAKIAYIDDLYLGEADLWDDAHQG